MSGNLRETRSVALILDLQIEHGRQILAGVAEYLRLHGPWDLWGFPPYVAPSPLPLSKWKGDGIIGVIGHPDLPAALARELKIPLVNVGHDFTVTTVPVVHVDEVAVGAMVGEFFLRRNYRHFAFAGDPREAFIARRLDGFRTTLERRGFTVFVVDSRERMPDELTKLPKPLALMAATDLWSYSVAQACRKASLSVPSDVSIVGVDNDSDFCELASTPLSSVDPGFDRTGFRAAELLDAMMSGRSVAPQKILYAPLAVVERKSSNATSVSDPLVQAARQFILERAGLAVQVPDVARAVGVSSRTLQRRFASALGRSVLEELHQAHLERAKQLLRETSMPVDDVARASGFRDARELSRAFRRVLRTSPRGYRRDVRVPHAYQQPVLKSEKRW